MSEPHFSSSAGSERPDPIRWIKDTYLMWLKGDLEPAHMRRGQEFFDKRYPVPAQPALETAPLRLCGYCKSWNSKPCGEGCCWSPTDPAIEKVSCGDALREALAAQPPAAPVETGDFYLVPREIVDRFPEINPSNYDHDDACALNAWGCEVVTNASPAPLAQLNRAEQSTSAPVKPFELTPLMLRLLKQAWSDGHIYPSDYMDRRLEEMTALREMAKHGFVHASEEDPRLPGPPAPPRWFITDKGLEAAAQPQVAPTQPFYGARCAAYPNCSGGCGCGCTHEID